MAAGRDDAGEGGVRNFLLPKSGERQGREREAHEGGNLGHHELQPPGELLISTALECVPGRPPGFLLGASGDLAGYHVGFELGMTEGFSEEGLDRFRLELRDYDGGIVLGDLESGIYGRARGLEATFGLNRRMDGRLGLYSPLEQRKVPYLVPVLGLEHRFHDGSEFDLEISGDTSYLLRYLYWNPRASFSAFLKGTLVRGAAPVPDGGYGIGVSYPLGGGFGLHYRLHETHPDGETPFGYRSRGLEFPLWKGAWGVIEVSNHWGNETGKDSRSVMVFTPLGSMRAMIRYSTGEKEGHRQAARSISDSLSLALSFSPSPRSSLSYTLNHEGPLITVEEGSKDEDMANRGLGRVAGAFKFPNGIDLEAGMDLILSGGHGFRVKLGIRLDPCTSLTLRYSICEGGGFGVSLARSFPIGLGGRTGSVEGYVRDIRGHPVSKVGVRAGNLVAFTGVDGYYSIKGILPGRHEVYLEPEALPALYEPSEVRRPVFLKGGDVARLDFTLVPLTSVSGVVFVDRNGNEACDDGEGAGDILVELDGFVVVTDEEGRFTFFDVTPGRHRVRLLEERLPRNLLVVSPGEWEISEGGEGLFFMLRERERDIVYESLDEDNRPRAPLQ